MDVVIFNGEEIFKNDDGIRKVVEEGFEVGFFEEDSEFIGVGKREVINLFNGALAHRIKEADRFDRVAKEFDPVGGLF